MKNVIKINNSEFVRIFENEITISKIGKIDLETVESTTFDSLFYKFPLIERIVLEIYKCVPGTNVEMYDQGTMKTINSIIDNNNSFNIIPNSLIDKINIYFNEDDSSPRNKIFHIASEDDLTVSVSFEEINYIIAQLLGLLNHVSKQYTLENLKKIDKI